jgi:hypothetical protein
MSTQPFENSNPVLCKEVLVTGYNFFRLFYFPPPIPRVLHLERLGKVVEKAERWKRCEDKIGLSPS